MLVGERGSLSDTIARISELGEPEEAGAPQCDGGRALPREVEGGETQAEAALVDSPRVGGPPGTEGEADVERDGEHTAAEGEQAAAQLGGREPTLAEALANAKERGRKALAAQEGGHEREHKAARQEPK